MVPKPRVNLTRFHGVLAPNSKHRINVTPAKRGKGSAQKGSSTNSQESSAESQKSLTWAERLKRVFKIDVSVCSRCGGDVKIIACIEDPDVINKILDHLDDMPHRPFYHLPKCRAPPQGVQYTCADWRKFVSDNNLELSMSRRGNCHDNAVAESFFSLLKTERIKRKIYKTRSEAKAEIFNYIELFYNPSRRHGNNDGVSPIEFEKQYYQKLSSL